MNEAPAKAPAVEEISFHATEEIQKSGSSAEKPTETNDTNVVSPGSVLVFFSMPFVCWALFFPHIYIFLAFGVWNLVRVTRVFDVAFDTFWAIFFYFFIFMVKHALKFSESEG